MAMRVQRYANMANVSKKAPLLDGLDVGLLKKRIHECGLNRFVHEGANHISNVEVHLKTRSANVNIEIYSLPLILILPATLLVQLQSKRLCCQIVLATKHVLLS